MSGPRSGVTVRYWAAAKAAAGVAEEQVTAGDLAELVTTVAGAHGRRLAEVLAVCSFLVDEHPVGTRPHGQVDLAGAGVVDVLPPFAGG